MAPLHHVLLYGRGDCQLSVQRPERVLGQLGKHNKAGVAEQRWRKQAGRVLRAHTQVDAIVARLAIKFVQRLVALLRKRGLGR